MVMKNGERLVILGGGFAGLKAARTLSGRVGAAVIDRTVHFDFLPNIHELLSGLKTLQTLRIPREELLTRWGHTFIRDEVLGVDPQRREVHLRAHRTVPYHTLLIALGGENATFGIPGVERHAFPFKSAAHCSRIADRLAELAVRGRPYEVVIVGGGLEGIEALGEILRRYGSGGTAGANLGIHLVEAAETLLAESGSTGLDRRIREVCRNRNVQISTGERVDRITPKRVRLASGRTLPSDLTIWTGGCAPPGLLFESGLTAKPGVWLPVDETLRSRDFPEIFAAGDGADTGGGLVKQAYHALAMGRVAADNMERRRTGRPLRPFTPAPKPVLIAFGDLGGFLIQGKRVVESTSVPLLKELVFQAAMADLDRPGRAGPILRLGKRIGSGFAGPPSPHSSLQDRAKRLLRTRLIS